MGGRVIVWALVAALALLSGCAAGPAAPTPTRPATEAPTPAPEFLPVPDRRLVAVYDEPFDDNGGDWLEPGLEANVIEGGEYTVTDIAGISHRVMGDVPLSLMPLLEVRATIDVHGTGLGEIGLYCRLDHGFDSYYRVAAGGSGVRITKTTPGDGVPVDLFRRSDIVLGPDVDTVLALACFAEDDGFHIDAFLDGELVAQAIDLDPPPEGGDVRVSWANLPAAQSDGPYVYSLRSLLLETRP
jgi:hypothetical protein